MWREYILSFKPLRKDDRNKADMTDWIVMSLYTAVLHRTMVPREWCASTSCIRHCTEGDLAAPLNAALVFHDVSEAQW